MPGKTWATAAMIAAVVLLAGCTPEPEPTPTPTGFASEAEAFAAAEETYRAYVEAGNQVDLSDPATFELMLTWTTAAQSAKERKELSELHAQGVSVSGLSTIVAIEPASWDPATRIVKLATCQDVSARDLKDSDGNSILAPDRPALHSDLVTFVLNPDSPTRLLIDEIGAPEVSACAG